MDKNNAEIRKLSLDWLTSLDFSKGLNLREGFSESVGAVTSSSDILDALKEDSAFDLPKLDSAKISLKQALELAIFAEENDDAMLESPPVYWKDLIATVYEAARYGVRDLAVEMFEAYLNDLDAFVKQNKLDWDYSYSKDPALKDFEVGERIGEQKIKNGTLTTYGQTDEYLGIKVYKFDLPAFDFVLYFVMTDEE